ncbi:hypothetical protein T265_11183 [Opisthorchis viverrini]|uniref:Uncharacterized protein n=1 Tax=Opisthorchis viverrini TaxID=6198 RepID=A0A074Z3Y7_OPIVI|nr:hypothetical protein T265_11183 [Opisthorchis viverrini]KER20212.1 hypothetical protein T265_11183 [Opisthorchis viverrini]
MLLQRATNLAPGDTSVFDCVYQGVQGPGRWLSRRKRRESYSQITNTTPHIPNKLRRQHNTTHTNQTTARAMSEVRATLEITSSFNSIKNFLEGKFNTIKASRMELELVGSG